MPFIQPDKVRYFAFDIFEGMPVTQAVFTRVGGVSKGYWNTLNVGLTVGDDPNAVVENRKRSFRTVGRPIHSLSDSWLTHGKDVFVYDTPRPADQKYPPKADIILTNNPDVTLFMRYADCVPILLYDPIQQAIGLAHAGWKGTVQKVGGLAVKAMQDLYHSKPSDILGAIGPAISPERYEIGEDTAEIVASAFGVDAAEVLPRYGDKVHFDLWKANRMTLEQVGVKHIENAQHCTAENPNDWYSHRGSKGKTGRFGVLLGLNGR